MPEDDHCLAVARSHLVLALYHALVASLSCGPKSVQRKPQKKRASVCTASDTVLAALRTGAISHHFMFREHEHKAAEEPQSGIKAREHLEPEREQADIDQGRGAIRLPRRSGTQMLEMRGTNGFIAKLRAAPEQVLS